jgi:hypothetical protein
MSTPPQQPSEEELRAAYEAELKKIRVEDVLVQTLVSLINLGGRRAGLAQGAEDEADPDQLRLAIEGSRALLPIVEDMLGPDAAQVRNALSQLQMAFAQGSGAGGAPGAEEAPPSAEEPPPPQQPGTAGPGPSKLWVPGQ